MPAGVSPIAVARFLAVAFRRRWWLPPLPAAAGLALGVAAAAALGKQSFEASGAMVYSPPPIPDISRGLYTPPDLNTLLPLAKSPEVLIGLCDEFDLPVPPALLDKLFKVTIPKGTQGVLVTFQWGEGPKAADMTNRLMQRFADTVRDYRRRKADGFLADARARADDCVARRTRAAAALQEFNRQHNLLDQAADFDTVRKEIDGLQSQRANALRDEAALVAQQARMTQELEDYKRKDEAEAADGKAYEAAMESVSEARRRQDRMRELIDDEKQRQKWLAELGARRKEYDRVASLRAIGAAAPAELDAVNAEVSILMAKLNDSEKVTKLKAELAKIDEVVVPKGKAKSSGSPIIQQALFRKLELDLKMAGTLKELSEADRGLADRRRRLAEVQALGQQSQGLNREIEAADAERQRLTDQAAFFTRLRDQTAGEFVVVTPARPPALPAASNRKLFVLGGAAAGMLAGLLLTAGWEALSGYHGGRRARLMSALPTVGEVTLDDLPGQRLAVSRLRDWRPGYGTVLVLAGDRPGCDPLPWGVRLARRLAARDERVLLVDCRLGELAPTPPDPAPGLGQFLGYEYDQLGPLLVDDEAAGVERLPAGTADSMDVLATHRMRELVEQARKRYSLTLLIGPDLSRPDGMDVLGRLADGVLAVLTSSAPATAAGRLAALAAARPDGLRALVVCDTAA